MTLTYGEVFAGGGGLSLGLERAGLECLFHAEIEEFPRRVLKAHWPDKPLLGDVRAITGGRRMKRWMQQQFNGVDLISGGSPCQDLSVAGNRAGMAGLRSSLYFRQVRLWKILNAPYFLWENVLGALSSNKGRDFALVLQAIVGGTVIVPSDGWRGSGVVSGPTGVAAWRVIDAQYFGVPQRRRRVFVLGARAGGIDPAKVLLEPDGVRRDPPSRREARKRIADSLTVGANQTCGFPGDVVTDEERSLTAWDSMRMRVHPASGTAPTLGANEGRGGASPTVFEQHVSLGAGTIGPNDIADPISASEEKTYTHEGGNNFRLHNVVAFDERNITHPENRSNPQIGDACHTLHDPAGTILAFALRGREEGNVPEVSTDGTVNALRGASGGSTRDMVVAFNETGHERWTEEDVAGSINAHEAKEAHTVVFKPSHFTRGKDGAPGDVAPPLSADADRGDQEAIVIAPLTQRPYADRGDGGDNLVGTLDARHAGGFQSVQSAAAGHLQPTMGIPRRLLPVECERLMSWPDGWTDIPDEKGKPASDSQRYRVCGNGVVSNCVEWIGRRLLREFDLIREAA